MVIDINILLLSNSIICFAQGFILLFVILFHNKPSGFLIISIAYLCLSVSFMLMTFSSYIPDYYIIASQTLSLASLILLNIGIERFRRISHKLIKLSLLFLCAVFVSSYIFVLVIPNTFRLEISFLLLIALQLAICLWSVLRATEKMRNYQYLLFASGILLITAISFRLFALSMHPDLLSNWPYWSHGLIYSVSLVTATLGFIWGSVEKTEMRRNEQTATLEQHYHFMNALLDAIPLPVFYKDKDLRFHTINKAFASVVGRSKDQIIGKTTLEIIPDLSSELAQNYDRTTLESGQDQKYETAFPFPDGLRHEIEIEKTAFTDISGEKIGVVGAFTDITERKIYEAKINYLAMHDQITGLPNRNMFYAQLKKAMAMAERNNYSLAILYIDLDGFKIINDSFGHNTGDTLLRTIGKRLSKSIRKSDTACRIGGDEFIVLIEMFSDPSDLKIIAEKLCKSLAVPSTCEGHICQVSASIGIALYPQDAGTSNDLVKAADAAMYEAKQRGKNRTYYYHSLMQNK
ncbi:GGDEF domain-containing protein [Desulfovibrio gilichinskyi]|uniref:PAS domain S-box-containing protein/diguanylate cyclase (GGDEF) domain-containing protein n=1 Tax=Desulfovibrio gilichinskyi TaxID=1519643 RepID=A0A1X7DEX0_9BACT|nr:GGDEF domain-containing protein [Desulfovibrio gilichinskyi]SMF14227.1 PAS domain S-box-containing protein/diguanylate cyclase (GGDEF) domain-containing protein [Desulfovibrio gilichinskyi]